MSSLDKLSKVLKLVKDSFEQGNYNENKPKIISAYNALNATGKKDFSNALNVSISKPAQLMGVDYAVLLMMGALIGVSLPLVIIMRLNLKTISGKAVIITNCLGITFFACHQTLTSIKARNEAALLPLREYLKEVKALLNIKNQIETQSASVAANSTDESHDISIIRDRHKIRRFA